MTAPPSQLPLHFTNADKERLRLQALAQIDQWNRSGLWSAGIKPQTEYATRPLEWITEKLEVPLHTIRWSENPEYATHQWDGDPDPLVKVLQALSEWNDCGVESATGTGKTFLAACVTLWFLACYEDALVITSAPKGEQLLNQVWREIGELWPRFKRQFPQAKLITGKLRMKPGKIESDDESEKEAWTALAFVAGVGADEQAAQKAAGFHRPHMLIITEDTPGIHNAIMTSFEHTRTDDHNLHLALGNPDHRNDSLHRFCFDEREQPRPGVTHVRISALDHPNIVTGRRIVPGAIGPKRLERRIRRYRVGTRLYQSRVRGICPAEPEEALIRWEWCVASAKLWEDPAFRQGTPALGVDVADSPEGDDAAIADFQGACCLSVDSWRIKTNAEEVAEKVYVLATNPERPIEGKRIGVDNVGVGASAANRLTAKGLRIRKIYASTKTAPMATAELQMQKDGKSGKVRSVVESERYNSPRSQVWWRAREDIMMLRVALPNDPELWQDLCTPTYTTKGGKICVQEKEEIIRQLRRSPNKGDAFCYGNFVRARPRPKASAVVAANEVKPSRNRDTRLERMLVQHNKKMKARERQIRRRFGGRAV